MDEKITLEELLDIVEKRIEQDELLILHAYDFNKCRNVFDLTIEPYDRHKTVYHELRIDDDNPYDVLFEALRDVYPNNARVLTSRGCLYGNCSVQIMIGKNVWIIFDYCTPEGEEWLEAIHNKYYIPKNKK